VTPDEVLERAPDVSRETWAVDEVTELTPELAAAVLDPPPLRKDQVARLEALTAVWSRDVRIGGPGPDDTLLVGSSAPSIPVPPPRPRAEVVPEPAPVPAADVVVERSRQLLEEEAAEEAAAPPRTPPAPASAPDPGRDSGPEPARVSDWTSRHDQRSLEFPVRRMLERPVPLQDVSLDAGPVLDQGTTPPLSLRDASACVGMACIAAAHVLKGQYPMAYDVEPFDEEDARRLYVRAQDLDHVHGNDYPGTSVLAGMKAGQELGLWGGYLWALGGTRDVVQVLLQLRVAVVVGVPWSAGLEEPDRDGVIRPGGADAGGHALAVVGFRLGRIGGRLGPWFELQQSRGRAEGIGGRVFLHHSDLSRLLGGIGEAAVPLPAELLP
jgi:hypothetical protein